MIENAPLITGIKTFAKPEGGIKRTFSIGLDDNGDGPQILELARLLEKGPENNPGLQGKFQDMAWEAKSPVWGDSGTALTLTWTDKTLLLGDVDDEDLLAGARVRVGCSVSAWFNPDHEKGVVHCGLTFKAESVKILEKKDASEVDWAQAL